MPILPIRNLGQFGVVSDINPYDLPINAISKANNVRFKDNKIVRANVFRGVLNTTLSTPVFPFTIRVAGNFDKIGMADRNGSVYTYSLGIESNVTKSGWTSSNSDYAYSECYLQGITYLNRFDRVPWFISETGTAFANLTNWDSTWRCGVLRAYKDYLVALNITKGTTSYPNMVKWSDIAQYGSVPGSWDAADPTVSAGENQLGSLESKIIDGLSMRDVFVIYSRDQIWLMEETGDALVFRFRKLFDNVGTINTNCVVEVEGRHYSFGPTDIIVHDGSSYDSIIDGTNRKFLYDNLNYAKTDKCYVQHDQINGEIIFAYVSGDSDASFIDTTYANRGAIYNYNDKTWTFVDLPNVGGMTSANYSTTLTYTTAGTQWDTFGGTWYKQESPGSQALFAVSAASSSNGLSASRLYGYESSSRGILPFSINTEATKQCFVERVGIDMDDAQEELRAYKVITAIYPQIKLQNNSQTVQFQFAGGNYSSAPITYNTSVSFSPLTDYKVDTREGGRYLAWKMTSNDYNDFELTGFDASVVSTGRR